MKTLIMGTRQMLICAALVLAAGCHSAPAPIEAQTGAQVVHDLGDDPRLDRLWAVCASGSRQACLDLEAEAPPLSEYYKFAGEELARGLSR